MSNDIIKDLQAELYNSNDLFNTIVLNDDAYKASELIMNALQREERPIQSVAMEMLSSIEKYSEFAKASLVRGKLDNLYDIYKTIDHLAEVDFIDMYESKKGNYIIIPQFDVDEKEEEITLEFDINRYNHRTGTKYNKAGKRPILKSLSEQEWLFQPVDKVFVGKKKSENDKIVQQYYDNFSGTTFGMAHRTGVNGRIYSGNKSRRIISPQADKHIAASILPNKAEMLTERGEYWLLYDMGQHLGYSGTHNQIVSYTRRLSVDKIEELAMKRPHKKKWFVLSNLREYKLHLKGKPCRAKIALDSSTSFAQMVAMATCDFKLAPLVNIGGGKMKTFYKPFMEYFDIDKETAKYAIMPASYGSKSEPERVFGNKVNEFWDMFDKTSDNFMTYFGYLEYAWDTTKTYQEFRTPIMDVELPVSSTSEYTMDVEGFDFPISTKINELRKSKYSTPIKAGVTCAWDATVCEYVLESLDNKGINCLGVFDEWTTHANYGDDIIESYTESCIRFTRKKPINMLMRSFGIKCEELFVTDKMVNKMVIELEKSRYLIG